MNIHDIGEDTVARRIVMRRSTWDLLVRVSNALRETRDVEVTPTEVARIALEAGLEEVRQGLGVKRKKRRGASPELSALLSSVSSVRARQRTIALWLGQRNSANKIGVEELRRLAIEHDAYDVANFAQNMKKDGAFFRPRRSDGKRVGWKLTREGSRAAKELLSEALAAV